jgi:hypothetical protein
MVIRAVAFSISMGLLISFNLLLSTIYTQVLAWVVMNLWVSVFRPISKVV